MSKCPSPCTESCDGACLILGTEHECTCWNKIANLDALIEPLIVKGGEIRIYADSPGASWLAKGIPDTIEVEKESNENEEILIVRKKQHA